MSFFLLNKIVDEIKSGKPIMYYNMETTKEEIQNSISDELQNDQKFALSKQTLKYNGYKNKPNKDEK